MYALFLPLHSLVRWFVLSALLTSVLVAIIGWRTNRSFGPAANRLRHITATIAHIQLLLGLSLYLISPLIRYFREHYASAIHEREIRFFGMEHSMMMTISVVLITVGSISVKRASGDQTKYKRMAIWFGLALILILSSIPWGFGPLISRPFFRHF